MIKTINSDSAPAAIGPYSQAKEIGDFIFSSGQIPLNPNTGELVGSDITSQTTQVIKNISAILSAANLTADDVVKTTCFLANIDDFSAFNDVYATFFTSKPARSCVAVKDLPKGALVEVEIIAYRGR